MRIFVVAGSPFAQRPDTLAPGPHDLVIAADRGAQHALSWGWPVHTLIGDLDSLPEALAKELERAGTQALTAPREKDETDTELALNRALTLAPEEIILCGALRGRTDHLLANVSLLLRPDLAATSVILADGPETVRLLRSAEDGAAAQTWLAGRPGDLVSLLPWAGDAEGITTEGLYYPLQNETLFLGRSRGVSNVMLGPRASVSLRRGALFVIHVALPADPFPQAM